MSQTTHQEGLSESEVTKLLTKVRHLLREIMEDSGFGTISIVCVNGVPKDLRVERSLRVERDILEEKIPGMSGI